MGVPTGAAGFLPSSAACQAAGLVGRSRAGAAAFLLVSWPRSRGCITRPRVSRHSLPFRRREEGVRSSGRAPRQALLEHRRPTFDAETCRASGPRRLPLAVQVNGAT